MTIQERIENANKRGEVTLNLSFPIGSVELLCRKWKIDPKTKPLGTLVEKIQQELGLPY